MIPYGRQKKENIQSVCHGEDFSIGEIRQTYDAVLKEKAVELYLQDNMGYDPSRKVSKSEYYKFIFLSQQKLYLSVIADLYNKEVAARQVSRRNGLKLIIGTLKKIKNGMQKKPSV